MEKKEIYYIIIFVLFIVILVSLKKDGLPNWDERLKFEKEVLLDIKFPTGTQAHLVCPEGMIISDCSLQYGDPVGSCLDADPKVLETHMKNLCNGKNECSFNVQDQIFNVKKECPSTIEKMLWGKYKCKR